ncbi:MAG: hypothetical protein GY759_06405, partial [Chloroflexi bacterium]|nr:hypothetical protein [Chloroflexota bacterium]
IVTVEDNVAPTAVCRDITIQIEASLDVSIMAGDIDDGSTDACGVNGLSLDQNTFDCGDRGDNPVNLTVTDVNGNSSSCEAVVTIEDFNMYCAPCVTDSVTVHDGSCEPADTGTMVEVWRNSLGCDSVVTTITSLLESYYVETWETTCDINEESKAEFHYTASNGCDSIVRTFIEWVPPILVNISLLTCDPGEVGVEEFVHQGSNGCDSIVTVSTILQFPTEVTVYETSCLPADTGTFVVAYPTMEGCDSIVTTIVELTDAIEVTINETTCVPGEEGEWVDTFTASNDCDSIVTTIIELETGYQTVVYEFSCNPADGGVEVIDLIASNGCDSTIIIKTEVELVRAGFNYNVTGTTAHFTNTGQYATGHFWVFGDGSTSTEENPSHTYARNGIYLVWQIVYAPQCGFDIKLKFVFVWNGVAG